MSLPLLLERSFGSGAMAGFRPAALEPSSCSHSARVSGGPCCPHSWDKGLQIMPVEVPRGGTSRGSKMRVLMQPEPGCSRVTFAKRSLLWKKKSICVEQASS